jgi:hypothetical protein
LQPEYQEANSSRHYPATDLPQREGAAFDQFGAQERALLIGQQIKELDEKKRTKAPD